LASRLEAALIAGAVAIALNTAALAAADLLPLATARGGLLRLLSNVTGVHAPSGFLFQTAFHIGVGLAMGVVYAFALEPILPGPAWFRGFVYGLAAWLTNALIVLPLIGEGFAGQRHLSLLGMAWFAAAHMVFFIVQAVIYDRMIILQKLPSFKSE
jgi:hypothetical protein